MKNDNEKKKKITEKYIYNKMMMILFMALATGASASDADTLPLVDR